MQLFTGLERTDYQDLLRAIGGRLDAEGWRDLRLIEDETGLIMQVRRSDNLPGGFLTYRLVEEDCLALLRVAYSRRALHPVPEAVPAGTTLAGAASARAVGFPPAAALGYEATLRGVGRLLDAAEVGCVRVIELPGALLVQGTPGRGGGRHPATRVLSPEAFRAALRDLGADAGASGRAAR